MWTHARTFDPGTEIPDGRQPAAEPEETVRNATASSPVAATEAAAEQQAHQEEEVLADLMQHYRQSSSALDWLPAAAFTAGPRREVYEAITALARGGQPIDELTVEWHLASSRAVSQPRPDLAQADARTGPPTWTDVLGYVGLLAALPVADGVATVTGWALLERHTRARQAPMQQRRPRPPALSNLLIRPAVSASKRRGSSSRRPGHRATAVVWRCPSPPTGPPRTTSWPSPPARPAATPLAGKRTDPPCPTSPSAPSKPSSAPC